MEDQIIQALKQRVPNSRRIFFQDLTVDALRRLLRLEKQNAA